MRNAMRWVVAVAALAIVTPSVVSAENFYTAVRGGASFTKDTRQGIVGGEDVIEFKSPGLSAGAALGYYLPFGLRVEGELGYLYNRVKTDGGVDIDGSIKNYLLMANAYYDLRIPALGPFVPYVGGGIGAARVNDDHEAIAESLGGTRFDLDEWRTAFAYQGRVGLIYQFNPWFDVSAGYRYVHVDGGHYDVSPARIRINVGAQKTHSLELGFAIKF